MHPTSKFGEVFQYSNLTAAAAGYISAHIVYPGRELGVAYDAAMQRMIFDPLGMKSTTFDYLKGLRHLRNRRRFGDSYSTVTDFARFLG